MTDAPTSISAWLRNSWNAAILSGPLAEVPLEVEGSALLAHISHQIWPSDQLEIVVQMHWDFPGREISVRYESFPEAGGDLDELSDPEQEALFKSIRQHGVELGLAGGHIYELSTLDHGLTVNFFAPLWSALGRSRHERVFAPSYPSDAGGG
ncbi:hypothetical protein [uncultured Tessaracoccus sp.]|uniref:hypothetical protein n=1 Tax=uncultured Tessaracoccus sp. TaxID=905023 RepID=UPI0025D0DCAE|nr:hypothetical protein [uncultured Tessaracoccus sp.]